MARITLSADIRVAMTVIQIHVEQECSFNNARLAGSRFKEPQDERFIGSPNHHESYESE